MRRTRLPFNAYFYPLVTAILAFLFLAILVMVHLSPYGLTLFEVPAVLIPEAIAFAGIAAAGVFHFARNLRR
jgi:hypothetical protein